MKNLLKISTLIAAMGLSFNVFADSTMTGGTTTTNSTTTTTTTDATANPMDAGIVANVQTKLSQDTNLSGFAITVVSNEGVVTLNGTVDSQAQADAALSAARSADGVKDVKSNLIVKSAS